MRKVLVTGGNSFTGQHLLPLLNSAGFETYSLTRDRMANALSDDCVDITDFDSLSRVISKIEPDYVIHLAGISFVKHPRPLEFYSVNLLGTENLLRAVHLAAPKIQKVILASSASIYGRCESPHIDEAICPSPVNHYAASKLAMEHMARTWMNRLPITIVRPFNYTGPGQDRKFLIPKIINHFTHHLPQISLDIRINQEFVRTSDILELRGNPEKLYSMIGHQKHPDIKETLSWMLEHAC